MNAAGAFAGEPIAVPVDGITLALLARAKEGRLVVCAGAGLSVSPRAGLPSGRELSEKLSERLNGRLKGYVPPSDPGDLVAVADAAAALMGDLMPLQREVLELADFLGAAPNYGHRALALLLAEGAVASVLLWNWDDCVERSAPEGERLQAAQTLEDVRELRVPHVAKIHGCATRPASMLITSGQLMEPRYWTEATFHERIRGATGVFVGIGDVADYAKRRISELLADIPELDVYVVSRTIGASWASSVWATVLPTLAAERRVSKSADVFLDDLARAWALELREMVTRASAALASAAQDGTALVLDQLTKLCGADLISWCRAAALRPRIGSSLVRSSATEQATIALGVLVSEARVAPDLLSDGCWRIGTEDIRVIVVPDSGSATDVRAEAERRAEVLAVRRQVDRTATFLVAGIVHGSLSNPQPIDVLDGSVDSTDVLSGPRGIEVRLISASEVTSRAA